MAIIFTPGAGKGGSMAGRALIRGGRLLYIDDSADSKEAATVLEKHHLEHHVVRVSDEPPPGQVWPTLIAGDFGRILGLGMIRAYAETISKWHGAGSAKRRR